MQFTNFVKSLRTLAFHLHEVLLSATLCEESSVLWHCGAFLSFQGRWSFLWNHPFAGHHQHRLWTQFLQDRTFVSIKENTKCSLVFACFRWIFTAGKLSWDLSSFTNLSNATLWYLLVKSVYSSNWMETLVFSSLYKTFQHHGTCHHYVDWSFHWE